MYIEVQGRTKDGVLTPIQQGPATSSPAGSGKSALLAHSDHLRARTKVPRHDYRGADFGDMSRVLNGWLNASYPEGPFTYDVHKISVFLDPLPPKHCHIHSTYNQY